MLRSLPRIPDGRSKNSGTVRRDYRKLTSAAISHFLDSLGYFDPVIDTSRPVWSVHPGNRTWIVEERLDCSPPSALDSLPIAPRIPGSYFYDAAVPAQRAKELVELFTNSGYPFAKVTIDVLPTRGTDSLTVLYHIEADKRYRFAPPQLRGRYSTARALLLHDLAIEPGSPFDSRAITRSLERLTSRNYIAAATALPVVVTTDSAGEGITVPLLISDRSGLGLDGMAALEARNGEPPLINGSIRFNFINLFHAGEEALLAYTGDRTRQRLDLGFSRPWLAGRSFTTDIGGGLEVVSDDFGYLYGNLGLFFEPVLRWQTGVTFSAHNVSRKDTTAAQGSNTYTGADLVLKRRREPYGDGRWSRELAIATGSGFTRKERTYNRSHIDFSAGVHLPLPRHLAVLLRGVSGHIITRESALAAAELYRVGGNGSLRGYREDEFAFRTVMYGQMELLYYFQSRAAVFLFSDGGIGFTDHPGPGIPYSRMFGYGLGLRIPAGIGMIAIEWARNIRDTRSPGRLHVGFTNRFAAATPSTPLSTGRP